jgi:hypothetical protein
MDDTQTNGFSSSKIGNSMIENKICIRKTAAALSLRVIVCFAICFHLGHFVCDRVSGQENLPTRPFQGPPSPVELAYPSQPGSSNLPDDVEPDDVEVVPIVPMALVDGNRVQLQSNADEVILVTRDAPLSTVLSMIAQQQGLNFVTGEDVNQRVNVTLNNVKLNDALDAILAVHGYTWARNNNIVTISSMNSDRKTSPSVQGRMVRVFTLNYVLASDVEKVVKGLMSPLGQTFTNQTKKMEQRNAHEQLIVEDMPPYLDRIAEYIAQVDTVPRQVIVEANILQVALKDNNRHGVNFNHLAQVSRSNVNFWTMGLASGTAPTSMMRIEGSDLTGLIDLLKSTNDTKTLASPKVAVLNGQEAKISVGGELGYLLTTATNTSTLQSVSFLPFGVILEVVPIISDDGQIVMTVSPEVSTARINPTSKVPDSEATKVTTTVMLTDGQAIVIGGLIKETVNDSQNKVPFLGDLWVVGRLFQSRDRLVERSEIIITLLPRITGPGDCGTFVASDDVVQASTPLLDRNLTPYDRSAWEGSLPDSSRKPRFWNVFKKQNQVKTKPAPMMEMPVTVETQPVNSAEIAFETQAYPFPPAPENPYTNSATSIPSNSTGRMVGP